MVFEQGYIYHIYNQGNNRQKIFFNRENYLFFLRKIRTYVLPYGDILAYCLMPNHFHLMVLVNETELPAASLGVSSRHAETYKNAETKRTFNASIGILLMGYTKAVNKEMNRTGKLFREATKAECVNCQKGKTPSFINNNGGITQINIHIPEKQYPQVCFNYIHQNPVKANLVKKQTDWEFSSAKDYAGLRNGSLINKEIA
ncbi:MAG: transposase, partial [Bacteroidales bacterium]|nr:transposase [Bacteroidales bacterium]MBN2755856.1 transposase [Bacteroidales bacterium]